MTSGIPFFFENYEIFCVLRKTALFLKCAICDMNHRKQFNIIRIIFWKKKTQFMFSDVKSSVWNLKKTQQCMLLNANGMRLLFLSLHFNFSVFFSKCIEFGEQLIDGVFLTKIWYGRDKSFGNCVQRE